MAARKFKIHLDARGLGFVEMDGEKVHGVYAVQVEGEVGQLPSVTLKIWACEVDVEAEAECEAPA